MSNAMPRMPSVPVADAISQDLSESWSSADEQNEQNSPRKRRRVSSAADDHDRSESPTQLQSTPSLSRVKPKKPVQARRDEDVPDSIKASIDSEDNTSFATLGVTPWLVASLANMAIKRPTGIQKRCIPEILKGRDCIGGSRTGSGKTVAFAVPILQKWAEDPSAIFALILTPTRYACSPVSSLDDHRNSIYLENFG
jgi:ATP-dependent RNA helicase DDX49/DBP8